MMQQLLLLLGDHFLPKTKNKSGTTSALWQERSPDILVYANHSTYEYMNMHSIQHDRSVQYFLPKSVFTGID